MSLSLSVILAVKDESDVIEDCLKSVQFADEIIVVVDSQTSDNTEIVARKYTEHVYRRDFDGFASQKNFAISKATQEWALLLDADERCTTQLAVEIQQTIGTATSPEYIAYTIPFLNVLLGKPMKYGGWQEMHVRLFRSTVRYSQKEIHEELEINGPVGVLSGVIEHYTHRSIEQILAKLNQYTNLEAAALQQGGVKATAWLLCYVPIRHFVYYYIRKQGFRDGLEGFIEVILSRSLYQFLIYCKLWELQRS